VITRDKFRPMAVDVPSRAWMLPDERVAVRLLSTSWANAEGVQDDLQVPRDLDAWLDAVGVDRAGTQATTGELARARGLRDSVRVLAGFVTAGHGAAVPSAGAVGDALREALGDTLREALGDALREVNAAAAETPAPALTLRGGHLELGAQMSVSPVAAGLARVAVDAVALFGGEDAAKLRACPAPGCVLYFVKTHPRREWCSAGCGNRVRAARHYQRVRSLR
jgi:predicted RNA-binding Zn ribbon-like protein